MKTNTHSGSVGKQVGAHATAKVPYRGDYGVIFEMACSKVVPVTELLRAAARRLHKEMRLIRYDLNVLSNPSHRSNRGKSRDVSKRAGYVRLVPMHRAA